MNMDQDEDIQIVGTTSDSVVQKLKDEKHGQAFAAAYLEADFLTSSANALFHIRREAGLTQAEVAERLNTKQSAIARLEADFDGSISLRRYVEFALACGMVPHNITFASIETARNFVIAQPDKPFTAENHLAWMRDTFQLSLEPSGNTTHTTAVPADATTLQAMKPKINAGGAQAQPFRPEAKMDIMLMNVTRSSQEPVTCDLFDVSQTKAA